MSVHVSACNNFLTQKYGRRWDIVCLPNHTSYNNWSGQFWKRRRWKLLLKICLQLVIRAPFKDIWFFFFFLYLIMEGFNYSTYNLKILYLCKVEKRWKSWECEKKKKGALKSLEIVRNNKLFHYWYFMKINDTAWENLCCWLKPFVFKDFLPPSVQVQTHSLVNFLEFLAQYSHCVFIEAHQENLGSKRLEESSEVIQSLFLSVALNSIHPFHQNCRPKQECVSLPVHGELSE